MNQLKTLGLLVRRSPFAIGGIMISVALCMVTCLDRIFRLLVPAIFSMLPDEYRRVILLVSHLPKLLPSVWSHFKAVRES
jgi:hypothetical protein